MSEDAGVLSRSELRLVERPAEQQLRVRLADQRAENEDMRDYFETRIKQLLPTGFPWEYIEQYANFVAKTHLIRDQQERMGFVK